MDLHQRIELTQQTLAALLAINNNGGKVPDGYVLEFQVDHQWCRSSYPMTQIDPESHYRLTPIPQPRRVPLTLADVPPGSVFSYEPSEGWFEARVTTGGIMYLNQQGEHTAASWSNLLGLGAYIHRPGGTWQPCWKEVTE